MKTLAEMSHYEVLEVTPDASPEELERAYRLARATYAEDSLAIYSIFGEQDSSAFRERIELAYRVLSDSQQRTVYDTTLGSEVAREDEIKIALDLAIEDEAVSYPTPEVVPEITGFDDFEEEDGGRIDGAWLRRFRLRLGVEIDRIASITKINPTYLRYIEEERFEDLPAPVYVRGFVSAYARCIGLDPRRVVSAYMERLGGTHRTEPRRRRRRWR